MSAPVPSHADSLAYEIDHPSLSWMNEDLATIVDMANLQSNQSVLVVGCSTGQLILQIVGGPNRTYDRMVGVDNSRASVQVAIQNIDDLGLMNDMRLLYGDPHHLDTINGLGEFFDVVLARNALPPDSAQCISILRHWTTVLTPASGRMVVTFSPSVDELACLAGVQAVIGDGAILSRMSWILEADWVDFENQFRMLVREAGLVVEELARVGLQTGDTVDMGEEMAIGARESGYELKHDYLWDVMDSSATDIKASLLASIRGVVNEDRYHQIEATFRVVPVNVKFVAVLKLE